MNVANYMVMGRKYMLDYNLSIGGVSSILSTKTLLANAVSIPTAFILEFEIIGNDVFALLDPNYTFEVAILDNLAFKDNSLLTFFKSNYSKITDVSNGVFYNCSELIEVDLNFVRNVQQNFLRNCPKINPNKVYLNSLVTRGYGFFRQVSLWGFGTTLNLPSLNNAPNSEDNAFRNFRGTLNLPSLINIPNYNLNAIFGTINIINCSSLGAPNVNNNIFNGCDSRTTINIKASMATVNSGTPDLDLVNALSLGATVNYI